nr:unnamed protein product [Digitaria exilis]
MLHFSSTRQKHGTERRRQDPAAPRPRSVSENRGKRAEREQVAEVLEVVVLQHRRRRGPAAGRLLAWRRGGGDVPRRLRRRRLGVEETVVGLEVPEAARGVDRRVLERHELAQRLLLQDGEAAASAAAPGVVGHRLARRGAGVGVVVLGVTILREGRHGRDLAEHGRWPSPAPELAAAEKLVVALGPRSWMAALSYTRAASSAVSKVPSQTRTPRHGSRISAANLPHGRLRTPRNLELVVAPGPPPLASRLLAPPLLAAGPPPLAPLSLLTRSPSPALHGSGTGAAGGGSAKGGSSRTILPILLEPHPSSSPEESVRSGSSQKILTVRDRDMDGTQAVRDYASGRSNPSASPHRDGKMCNCSSSFRMNQEH